MANSALNEVPQGGPTAGNESTSATDGFVQFMRNESSRMVDAGSAYANKRVEKAAASPRNAAATASKVLVGAQFIPAHPDRMRILGDNRGKKYKYFVFHRPGSVLRPGDKGYRFRNHAEAVRYATSACRVDNIILEFLSAGRPASTHFIISNDGSLTQMIDLDDLAYHTLDQPNPFTGDMVRNDNSIGVELEGFVQRNVGERSPFTEAQIQASAKLIRLLHTIYGMPLDEEHILMHSKLDPQRKIDPGSNFPLQRVLAKAADVLPFTPPYYQPDIDIAAASTRAAIEFGVAAMGVGSRRLQAALVENASLMQSIVRTHQLANASRSDYYASATRHTQVRVGDVGRVVAGTTRANTVYTSARAVPQENRSGLSLNEEGYWS